MKLSNIEREEKDGSRKKELNLKLVTVEFRLLTIVILNLDLEFALVHANYQ